MSHIIDFADARRRFETGDRSAIALHERETDPENPDHAEHLIIGRTAELVQAKILALEEELANHLGRHGYQKSPVQCPRSSLPHLSAFPLLWPGVPCVVLCVLAVCWIVLWETFCLFFLIGWLLESWHELRGFKVAGRVLFFCPPGMIAWSIYGYLAGNDND